jgi:hypothetical protein
MPAIALRYLRASFFFLVYGILIGLHLSAAIHLERGVYGLGYISAHTHIQMIGFLLMGIAGVTLWRLPDPAPGTRSGTPQVCWWGFVVAVLLRSTLEISSCYVEWSWLGGAIFAVSCFEALVIFVLGRHLLRRARALREVADPSM